MVSPFLVSNGYLSVLEISIALPIANPLPHFFLLLLSRFVLSRLCLLFSVRGLRDVTDHANFCCLKVPDVPSLDIMKPIRMCHYYDMQAEVTSTSGRLGFTFHVTRCHQFLNLAMCVEEPETYLLDSWPEISPGILSHPGVVEHALEVILSDIGMEGHFIPSMVPVISSAILGMPSPCFTLDVTLYLFSFEEECTHLDRESPSQAIKESTPCSICLEEVHGDPGLNVTKLPCLHDFHTACIIRWLCSANATCPLCRRNIDV